MSIIIRCTDCGWVGNEKDLIARVISITDVIKIGITLQTSTLEEQCPNCLSVFIKNKEK